MCPSKNITLLGKNEVYSKKLINTEDLYREIKQSYKSLLTAEKLQN